MLKYKNLDGRQLYSVVYLQTQTVVFSSFAVMRHFLICYMFVDNANNDMHRKRIKMALLTGQWPISRNKI